jgi:N-formylglutamate amidohydrolase
MSFATEPALSAFAPIEVSMPADQSAPIVLASPHSGSHYPEDLLAAARIAHARLRRSEDCFVDELFAAGPEIGVPLVRALFARVYVDPNREPFELDPEMFEGELPDYVNTRSPRLLAGLGTIARMTAGGEEIYGGRLAFADALRRIESCYRPFHAALAGALEATRRRFGSCVLIDCHSMPSSGPRGIAGCPSVDVVLGDCHGSSCAPFLVERVESILRGQGYRVGRNAPYSGGYITRHYGRPREGVHALQIELNRMLYMDEAAMTRGAGFAATRDNMTALIHELTAAEALVAAQ